MEKFHGKLSIGKITGLDQNTNIRITLEEENSHCQVIDLTISIDEFAQGIFGLFSRPCEFNISSDPSVWGKKREIKKEKIPRPENPLYGDEIPKYLKKAVIPWEVEGWKAEIERTTNTRQHDPHYFFVVFSRYIGNPYKNWSLK